MKSVKIRIGILAFALFSTASVSSAAITCNELQPFAGTSTNVSSAIQSCIDKTPSGEVLEIPAGRYFIDSQIQISKPLTLKTSGLSDTVAPCTFGDSHSCAEFRATSTFSGFYGLVSVTSAGVVIDHIVIHGNKGSRGNSSSKQECQKYNTAMGYNIYFSCSSCTIKNSVSRDALCGTALVVSGQTSNVMVSNNTIANNGVHNAEALWADGLTVHDSLGSTFTGNVFIDNTDIDFVLGGCKSCKVQGNTILHSEYFENSSFAALHIQAWPGSTSGDYSGSDISNNVIDCGYKKRCGFGLYLGSDAWYSGTDVHGGSVHDNTIMNAQFGFNVDDVRDMKIARNIATSSGGTYYTSCGTKSVGAYNISSNSWNTIAIDRLGDTVPDSSYSHVSWDGCLPNPWSNNPEDDDNQIRLVHAVYSFMLSRKAESGGMLNWLAALKGGMAKSEMLVDFYRQSEFQAKYSIAAMSNSNFVKFIYSKFLQRAPDPSGFKGWLDALNSNRTTRENAVRGFVTSPEFKARYPQFSD